MVSAARVTERRTRDAERAALLRECLVRLGAQRDEVQVSQADLSDSTGLTLEQVRWAATQLRASNTIVMDRPRDAMVPYSYRVVR